MRESLHRERFFSENGHLVLTTDETNFYADIDQKNGWTEKNEPPAAPQAEVFDEREIPIPPQSEGIIRLLALLLASSNVQRELVCVCSAFGMSSLLGGKSFTQMAIEVGISKQAFSKRVGVIQSYFHLPITRVQKSLKAREVYREVQKKVWQRPDRQTTAMQAIRHAFSPETNREANAERARLRRAANRTS